LRFLFF